MSYLHVFKKKKKRPLLSRCCLLSVYVYEPTEYRAVV